jgi:hypothetical protein
MNAICLYEYYLATFTQKGSQRGVRQTNALKAEQKVQIFISVKV